MFLITSILCVAITAVVLFGASVFLKKKSIGSSGGELATIVANVEETTGKIQGLVSRFDSAASSAQLETINKQLEGVLAEIAAERQRLKDIETRLESAQKAVEAKETAQQEVKAAKSEDERKLEDLLASYTTISEESILLEQQLASSLKNLDRIMEEVELTADQKSLLNDLSNALSSAGSRLRELLTEYEKVNERLLTLKTQHTQLEEEYTKLVEQQLGE